MEKVEVIKMSDKEIINVLETECCSECSYQPISAVECKCEGCKFKEAIIACIAMLKKRVSDRTPFE